MGNEKTLENGITVKGATLLTIEEAKMLPEETRAIGELWWLQSPGYRSSFATTVNMYGSVVDIGLNVNYPHGSVRPALELSDLKSSNLQIGDIFKFGNKDFEIVSDTRALCTEIIGDCAFLKDWKVEGANVYETSDVKKFVDQWYEKALELELTKQKDLPPQSNPPVAESKQPSFRADGPDLNDAVKRATERNQKQKTATPQSKSAPKRDDGVR